MRENFQPTPSGESVFAATLLHEATDYGIELTSAHISALESYHAILNRWNPRLHLVAPIGDADFARRHILESLFASQLIKPNARIVDVGSGGGLPIVPLLITRADVRATLIEANTKKSVFLREALIETACAARAEIIVNRFEAEPAPTADTLTCRALDRFAHLLPQLLAWSTNIKSLLLFGGDELRALIPDESFDVIAHHIPQSERRFVFAARRR